MEKRKEKHSSELGAVAQKFTKDVVMSAVKLHSKSKKLPQGTDYRFYSSFGDYKTHSAAVAANAGALLSELTQWIGGSDKVFAECSDGKTKWDVVNDVTDHCLEAVDSALDANSRRRVTQTMAADTSHSTSLSSLSSSIASTRRTVRSSRSGDLSDRPQLHFAEPIDNGRDARFLPIGLTEEQSLFWKETNGTKNVFHSEMQPFLASKSDAKNSLKSAKERLSFAQTEWGWKWLTEVCKWKRPLSVSMTPCFWVHSAEELREMVERISLSRAKAIGVAVLSHDTYSFEGITCLLCISTRTEDFLVDALALRSECRALLQPLLANPRIVKVTHDSAATLKALQRDLSLFAVGLMDTANANGSALTAPLPSLLEYYGVIARSELSPLFDASDDCNITDWRLRPLRNEALFFAQQTSHFLVPLFEAISNALLLSGTSLLTWLTRSQQLCAETTFCKTPFDSNGWSEKLNRDAMAELCAESGQLVAALWNWRDSKARHFDVKPSVVLSDELLIEMVRNAPLTLEALTGDCLHSPLPRLLSTGDLYLEILDCVKANAKGTGNRGKTGGVLQSIDVSVKVPLLRHVNMVAASIGGSEHGPESALPKLADWIKPRFKADAKSLHILKCRTLASEIYEELRSEPLLNVIESSLASGKAAAKSLKQVDGNREKRRKGLKQLRTTMKLKKKQKRENEASAIYTGSKHLKSAKDAFKLPRKQMEQKQFPERFTKSGKRKKSGTLQTAASGESKKRRASEMKAELDASGGKHFAIGARTDGVVFNAKRRKLATMDADMDSTTVAQLWPYAANGQLKEASVESKSEAQKGKKKKKKKKSKKAKRKRGAEKDTDKKPMTEEDLWDMAPVPHMDTAFSGHFDPSQQMRGE